MWRESVIKIAEDMAPLSCAVVPAHPWIYGLGQSADSGSYLSPANALTFLARKLTVTGGSGSVVVLMVAGNTYNEFITRLNDLATVFPAPALIQVSRMARAAAALSTEKMQIPAKAADLLPSAVPLSVPPNRLAVNAQRIAAATREAAAGASAAGLGTQLAEFMQQRASALTAVGDALNELKDARAKVLSFTWSGDLIAGAIEMLKDIPLPGAVHTAAMMFTGNNLDTLEKMIDG